MNPAAPITPHPLSKSELPALTNQALEADLIQISTTLLARGWMLATAESCTGGMIAAACTDLAGSSQWFERGFVTYSNEAKTELLGVPAGLIATHGAQGHGAGHGFAHGAVGGDQPGRHAQQFGLGFVGIGDEAALKPLAGARQVGTGGGNHAARATFSSGQHPAAFKHQIGQWPRWMLRKQL